MNFLEIYYLRDILPFSEGAEETQFFRFAHRDMTYAPLPQPAGNYLFTLNSIAHYTVRGGHLTVREGRPDYQLLLTVGGEALVTYRGKQYRLLPHSAMLVDCRLPHRYEVPEDCLWEYKHLHFSTEHPELLTDRVPDYLPDGGDAERIFDEIVTFSSSPDAMSTVAPAVYSQYTDELLTSLMRSLYNQTINPTQKQLQEVIRYMHEHFDEPLSLSALAERFHYSEGYLIAAFKKTYRTTPHQYLIHYRVRRVQERIAAGESVQEAALACGFNSAGNYYYARKKR